jgi:hypothetical protein
VLRLNTIAAVKDLAVNDIAAPKGALRIKAI